MIFEFIDTEKAGIPDTEVHAHYEKYLIYSRKITESIDRWLHNPQSLELWGRKIENLPAAFWGLGQPDERIWPQVVEYAQKKIDELGPYSPPKKPVWEHIQINQEEQDRIIDEALDYGKLLNDYGPEGLRLIADKLKKIADDDMREAMDHTRD